jgi:two-component system, NarL family, response regulator LiaR
MSEQTIIRVMVVDDHMVVRQGFATFLKAYPDLEMVGEASNGQEAIQRCLELQPDVILMDMMMPQMNGVDATRIIREQNPDVQVIALTSFSDDKQLVQAALGAGATGYLFKDVSAAELVKTILAVHSGTPVLSPEATRLLIQVKTERPPQSFNLSERELEVLALLIEGLSNGEIALRLSISRSTIKFHVSSILGKLGAHSRTEAVSIAHQHKLVK